MEKNDETQKDRILVFARYLGMSQREFEKSIGVSNGVIGHSTGGLSTNTIKKVTENYPDLNKMWIISGDGNMLHSTASADNQSNVQVGNGNSVGIPTKKFENEEQWFALVAEKDRQIDRLLSIIENFNKR